MPPGRSWRPRRPLAIDLRLKILGLVGWRVVRYAGGMRYPDGGGPDAAGYADQCWPLARIADQVWQRFGVEYTLAGMDVLLYRMGWSIQVPARRAAERDDDQIARWREEIWPVIKGRRRTWAPGSASRTSPARA